LIPKIATRGYAPKTYGANDLEKKKELEQLILSKMLNPDTSSICVEGSVFQFKSSSTSQREKSPEVRRTWTTC